MSLPPPEFNPKARLSGMIVGRDRSPIVIVDDVFANAEAIAVFGRREAVFTPPATAYPGLNAPVGEDAMAPWLKAVQPLLVGTFGASYARPACAGYFGLVTLKPDELSSGQAIPHVDNIGHHGLAAVAYLCSEDQGGTGFYRHRATGLERLGADTIDAYNAAIEAETLAGLPSAYTVGDHPLFACIGAAEARFNRIVIYNCNLLHSGQVDPARLSADPAKGRLTLNLFVA